MDGTGALTSWSAGDNLTATVVNGLDPGASGGRLLHSCGGALLQGRLQQEVGGLDVTMHGVSIMTHCNGLQCAAMRNAKTSEILQTLICAQH